jgi:hypothetical protein
MTTIECAVYGPKTSDEGEDVTVKFINEIAKYKGEGTYIAFPGNWNAVFGDPYPGQLKNLTITMSDGSVQVADEHAPFNFDVEGTVYE